MISATVQDFVQLPLFETAEEPEPAWSLQRPRTGDEREGARAGARRLAAAILLRAIVDERLLARDRPLLKFDAGLSRQELDRFWRSAWCEHLCQVLDIDYSVALQLVEAIRNGTLSEMQKAGFRCHPRAPRSGDRPGDDDGLRVHDLPAAAGAVGIQLLLA